MTNDLGWDDEYDKMYEERRSRVELDFDLEGEPEPDPIEDPYSYVLGMDPGGTTGIAMLRYTPETQPELIYLHQITEGAKGFLEFFDGSEINSNLTIVSESFTIREGIHGVDVTPLRIEGIQQALWGDEVVYQDPSMKSLVPDEWLKEQNLWTPGKRHQMDALIHAIVYLRNNDHKPTQKSLSGQAEETIAEEGEVDEKQLGDENFMEQLAEMIKVMVEANEDAMKSDDEGGDGESDGDGETGDGPEQHGKGVNGPAPEDTQKTHHYDIKDPETTGVRKRRERNGSFSGFESDGEENDVLFVD